MRSLLRIIDSISAWSGKIVSFLAVAFCIVILYEVVSRYIFNSPTIWAHEISLSLYGIWIVLLGAYILHEGGHVNVDVIYNRFSPRRKAIIDLFTWLIFFLWTGMLVWEGWQMGWYSVSIREHVESPFACPIYPVKICIPLGALLLFLQGLAKYIRAVTFLITGKEV